MNKTLIFSIAGAVVAGAGIGVALWKRHKKKVQKATEIREKNIHDRAVEETMDSFFSAKAKDNLERYEAEIKAKNSEESEEEPMDDRPYETKQLIYYEETSTFLDENDDILTETYKAELEKLGFTETLLELPETQHHIILKDLAKTINYFIFIVPGKDPYTLMKDR